MCVCLRLDIGYAVLIRLVYICRDRVCVPATHHRVCGAHTSCLCLCVLYSMYIFSMCVCACASLSGTRCSYVLLVFVCTVCIYQVCVCVPAPHHRVHDAHASCLCRDWSSHAPRTMSSIKTNVYGAALEYGLEDHKGVESCRRQQITS